MNLIVEFCIVFLICMAGEWIAALLPFTLPASVISLILLLILLLSGGVKERTIQGDLPLSHRQYGAVFHSLRGGHS